MTRGPDRAKVRDTLLRRIESHVARRGPTKLMEVCGTHTMAIAESGLRSILPDELVLVSGPGCPVCVTPPGVIDAAIDLSARPGVIVASFGDMMRVPASRGSLEEARGRGAKVEVLYSARGALELARAKPDHEVVFVAVGFETTAPTVAACLEAAEREGLDNLLALVAHKLVPPALDALLAADEVQIDGFLLPGHVSVIIGSDAYEELLQRHGRPGVITGFEPLEILRGIEMCLRHIEAGGPAVDNAYPQAVSRQGNVHAQQMMARCFRVVDASWRGIGAIPRSGLGLAAALAHRDASKLTTISLDDDPMPAGCACGEVLQGKITPAECPLFGSGCTPRLPVGPCMVSSEGACAAAYRFREALA